MPTLDWIGKKAVVGHHREVPFHLLRENPELSAGEPGTGNLLVQGDNLLALKALLPYYAGQVKCIYIDPPYNTGKERWVYNDNVNAPEIQRWLGEVVGREAEDLSRHDKWLCMMYPRILLLKQFLRDDGIIFISIGKDEIGHLRALCDEIFGMKNLLEVFIWQIEGNVENQEDVTTIHEYVVAYAKRKECVQINTIVDPNVDDASKILRDFAENSVIKNGAQNPASLIELPVGFPCVVESLRLDRHACASEFVADVRDGEGYISRDMKERYGVEYPIRLDDLIVESGVLAEPCRVFSGWSSARKLRRFIELGYTPLDEDDGSKLTYFISATGVPSYRREARTGHFVPSILRNMGTTEKASNELERMGVDFDYPKPVPLVEHLLAMYTKSGDVVLDSFAGSGTTGHAVLKLNHERNLNLRFLLVELDPGIAQGVTARRLAAVSNGYEPQRGARRKRVAGLGGGFHFCELGPTLFDADGRIRDEVSFEELARHVYFTETGEPLPEGALNGTPLLGVANGTAVYLLYNGILKDRSPNGGNALTREVLASLPPHDGPKIVYGTSRRVSPEMLRRAGVTFRQTPYDIRTR